MEPLAGAEADPEDPIRLVLLQFGERVGESHHLASFLMPLPRALGQLGDDLLQPGQMVLDVGDAQLPDFHQALDLALHRPGKGVVLPRGEAEPGAEPRLELIQIPAFGRLREQGPLGSAEQGGIGVKLSRWFGVEDETGLKGADHVCIASSARLARLFPDRRPYSREPKEVAVCSAWTVSCPSRYYLQAVS